MRTIKALIAFLLLASPLLGDDSITSFVVYPADTNHMGTLFGGKIMMEMDRAAGIATRRFLAKSKETNTAVTGQATVNFLRPAKVGELIRIDAVVADTTDTTVTIRLHAFREVVSPAGTLQLEGIARGEFVFHSVKDGRPIPHKVSR